MNVSSKNAEHFSPHELDRLQAETFLERIEFHPELASTNDLALELVARGDVPTPLLVLTERQTAGRGRGGNRWWSDTGSLTFSLGLKKRSGLLCAQHPSGRSGKRVLTHFSQVSLTVGLAICETLEAMLPGCALGLKWPNDVFLAGRKVCGILVEVPSAASGSLIVGIGLNVNNSFASVSTESIPVELPATATSLLDATGREYDRVEILTRLLCRVDDRLQSLWRGGFDLPELWKSRCLLSGHAVQVAAGRRQTVGICRGIDDDGALLLETGSGVERCQSGVVTRIE